MSPRPEQRADILIVTAIPLEFEAVLQVDAGAVPGSTWIEDKQANGVAMAYRSFIAANGHALEVAVAVAGDMATAALLSALLPLIDQLHPRCIAMCGVCAGRPGKVQLGDVIAAERLFFHDAGKQSRENGEPELMQQDLRTFNLRVDWKIELERLNAAKVFHGQIWLNHRPLPSEWRMTRALWAIERGTAEPWREVDDKLTAGEWKPTVDELRKRGLLEGRELTAAGRTEAESKRFDYSGEPDLSPHGQVLPFKVHVAPIASGNKVIEDQQIWSHLAAYERKTLGLDMEAAALGAVAHYLHNRNLHALVMKGVMDFANHGRDDHFKEFAARASAECLLWFLLQHLETSKPIQDSTGEEALRQFKLLRPRLVQTVLAAPPVGLRPGHTLMVLQLVPVTSLDETPHVDRKEVREKLLQEMTPYATVNGWDFLQLEDSIATVAVGHDNSALGYTRLFINGAMQYVAAILGGEDGKRLNAVAYTAVRSLERILPAINKLKLGNRGFVSIDLLRTRGTSIVAQEPWEQIETSSRMLTVDSLSPRPTLAELAPGADAQALLRPALDQIWNAGGFESCFYFDGRGRLLPP